jgi:hypothetical protein
MVYCNLVVSAGFGWYHLVEDLNEWKEWLKKNKITKPIANIENHDTIGTTALRKWRFVWSLHHKRLAFKTHVAYDRP